MTEKFEHLLDMLNSGKINEDVFSRAVGKMVKELEGGTQNKYEAPQALRKDSSEAYMFEQQAIRNEAERKRDPVEKMQEAIGNQTMIQKQLLTEARAQSQALRDGTVKINAISF
jgi:predicted RNA-binding protein associated with RNAse of E/G family